MKKIYLDQNIISSVANNKLNIPVSNDHVQWLFSAETISEINRAEVKQKYIDVLVEKEALPIYKGELLKKDEIPNMPEFIKGITLYHESSDDKKSRSQSNKNLRIEARYNYQNVSKIRIDLGLSKNGIGREISGTNDPISAIWKK